MRLFLLGDEEPAVARALAPLDLAATAGCGPLVAATLPAVRELVQHGMLLL